MAKARQILFRIFYSTTFTIIFFVLLGFICISPADTLYQSYHRNRIIDIFLIAGVYIVTGLVAALIYASRLFTNRSVLKEIPKTYMPIERDDLPGHATSRFIADILKRSAVLAYLVKPRGRLIEDEVEGARDRIAELLVPESGKERKKVEIVSDWSEIQHAGWSSPAAVELPNLQYETVVKELIDLIEAKAVSLAPVDKEDVSIVGGNEIASPDWRVIEALTRPMDAGMRSYIAQLAELEVIVQDDLTSAFIQLYERARFAPRPLSGVEFQSLMRMFAEVLRSMKAVNLDLVESGSTSDDDDGDESDEARDGAVFEDDGSVKRLSRTGKQRQHDRKQEFDASTSSISSVRSDTSVIHRASRKTMVEDSASSHAADEESTPSPRSNPHSRTRNMAGRSHEPLQSDSGPVSYGSRPRLLKQRPSARSVASTHSGGSMARSTRSNRSDNGSVVVRLTDEAAGGHQSGSLPYTIEIPSVRVPVIIVNDR